MHIVASYILYQCKSGSRHKIESATDDQFPFFHNSGHDSHVAFQKNHKRFPGLFLANSEWHFLNCLSPYDL